MLSGFENPFHLLIIAVVILMLFGAKRLPEMGRSLGSGMREFRDGVMGREPSPPAQGALEASTESVSHVRHGDPVV
ncbi:MAG TPA: twin-arginine translocase TatA/TatE family subunit [Solirubrobacteraceae bacterium]|nr:twin-arginine translocase TatA/TatE family subunit [Solirubrobacteraceae bacterium]